MEATNTIRDALAFRIEPVYGLTTMHASLRAFQADPHHPLSDDLASVASMHSGQRSLGQVCFATSGRNFGGRITSSQGDINSSLYYLYDHMNFVP